MPWRMSAGFWRSVWRISKSIKGPHRRLPGLKPGDYLKATVSDTGPGIPPDIMGKVFEPYFTTKQIGEGTGLGLSLVHGIVETYGGRIWVDSELGKGTTFTIYLPITKKEGASPVPGERRPAFRHRANPFCGR